MKTKKIFISVLLLSVSSVAAVVRDFVKEQYIFNSNAHSYQANPGETKGLKKTVAGDVDRELSWEEQAFNTGPGMRINQVEYDKGRKNIRLRSTTFINEDVRTVTECQGKKIDDSVFGNSESNCVTVTRRICDVVLKKIRNVPKDQAKLTANELKTKVEECGKINEKYSEILKAFTSTNSGDERAFNNIMAAEKENVKKLVKSAIPSVGFNWVNDLSDVAIYSAVSTISKGNSDMLSTIHEFHRYISLCEQTENRFSKANIPIGNTPAVRVPSPELERTNK